MTVEETLAPISEWSVVVPLLAGLLLFKSLSFQSRIITMIAALSTVPQLMNAFNQSSPSVKNFAYNLYTPLEFLLLYFIFYKYINSKKGRLVVNASVVIYVLLSVWLVYNGGFANRFLNEWACINNFIYTIWILIIFYKQYSLTNSRQLNFQTPVFWFFTGLLFYTPCSSIVFSIWPIRNEPAFIPLKSIHHIVNISMYVCFTAGIYIDAMRNRSLKKITVPG